MTQNRDIRSTGQSISEMHLQIKRLRYVKAHNRRIGEEEILQRIEIESAFQARLVAALDKEGCFVTNVETTEERGSEPIREEHGRKPERTIHSWGCFRVHLKEAPDLFWLTVWLSDDKSSLPPSFSSNEWRALGGGDKSVSGPSKTKELNGVSFIDSTPPLCCHLLLIDARLRFETLPLPAMREALLDGHLADELATKIAVAFERIRAITADRETGCVSKLDLTQHRRRIFVDGARKNIGKSDFSVRP